MATLANGTNGALTNGHPSSWQAKHDIHSHFIGGNHLDAAPASAVKDFVLNSDGHSVITSVSRAFLAAAVHFTKAVFPGTYRQQRYCSSEGNPISTKMGLRDLWQ